MKHSIFVFALVLFTHALFAQEKIELEQVVSLALEKNYDVQVFRSNALTAATDNNYAPAAFLPVISANGSRIWNGSNQEQKRLDNTLKKDTIIKYNGIKANNTNATVQLTWTLFDGTKMFATRRRIEEIAEQGELNLKNQMINTIASIVTNYYNIVRQKQQLIAIQEQMSVSEERVKLAEKKLQVGTGAKPELLQAKVDLNAQRTQVLQQQTAISQLKDQLNGLVGMELPSIYDVSDSIAIDLNINIDGIAQDIQKSNFALKAFKKNLDIASLVVRERQAERYPVISFTSAYSYSRAQNTVSINPSVPLYSLNSGYNYGLTATLPILNGLNNRRLVQQARISLDRQEILYNQQKSIINVGIRNASVSYDNARKILIIEEENILLAKENVFIALESFKKGVTTFIELRTAQQSLADAYNQLITARYNAKLAETELLRLNGGLLK